MSSIRPTPEVLGLATALAAFVGLGSLWFFTRRRRRQPDESVPAEMKSKVAPAAVWTNVRLDDNDALPPLLRAIAESERAPLAGGAPHFRHQPVSSDESVLDEAPLLEEEPLQAYEPTTEDGSARWNEALLRYEPVTQDEPAALITPVHEDVPPAWPEPPHDDVRAAVWPEPLAEDVPAPLPEDVPASAFEVPARAALSFAGPLEEGAMRLAITADETELLDQAGDIGVVLATLIFGDEVEIQDLEHPWVRVLTPLGVTGWIPAASLGVGGAAPEETASETPADTAAAPEPKRRFRLPRRSGSTRPAT